MHKWLKKKILKEKLSTFLSQIGNTFLQYLLLFLTFIKYMNDSTDTRAICEPYRACKHIGGCGCCSSWSWQIGEMIQKQHDETEIKKKGNSWERKLNTQTENQE